MHILSTGSMVPIEPCWVPSAGTQLGSVCEVRGSAWQCTRGSLSAWMVCQIRRLGTRWSSRKPSGSRSTLAAARWHSALPSMSSLTLSTAGELLFDGTARVLLFDGTARLLSCSSAHHVCCRLMALLMCCRRRRCCRLMALLMCCRLMALLVCCRAHQHSHVLLFDGTAHQYCSCAAVCVPFCR